MKSPAAGAASDAAVSNVIGAILLFGILAGALVVLNITTVPAMGYANENAHFEDVLGRFGDLQARAASASGGTGAGAAVAGAIPLGPPETRGHDIWDAFLATPARASGNLRFDPAYGNITLTHTRNGSAVPVADAGGAAVRFPMGRILFEPNDHFRHESSLTYEAGAVLSTDLGVSVIRFAPAITVNMSGGIVDVAIDTQALTGAGTAVGGVTPARLGLVPAGAARTDVASPNADEVTLRMETGHGAAWGKFLNATADNAGLMAGSGYTTTVSRGTGSGGIDIVTWTVSGVGTGNDIRLRAGVAFFRVSVE